MGLNLFGVVDAARFDAWQPKEQRTTALQPECGTVVVLGSGGRTAAPVSCAAGGKAWDAAVQARATAHRLSALLAENAIQNRCVEPTLAPRLNFARLAEAAGFGMVSPVSGLLLHPQFGPWVSVRAALLVRGRPFGQVADASITDRFQPCCSCDRPCITACPAAVYDGLGHQALERCAEHRHVGGCSTGCGSRSACPVGAEHRDGDAHRHAHSLTAMRRWFGLGVWRYVPRFWRGSR